MQIRCQNRVVRCPDATIGMNGNLQNQSFDNKQQKIKQKVANKQ
jgi:hypothetical protein